MTERANGIDSALLARYFAGEATIAEQAEVRRWTEEDAARVAELAAMRRIWDQTGGMPPPERIGAMWDSLSRRIRADQDETNVSPTPPESRDILVLVPPTVRPRWRTRVRAAAVQVVPALLVAALVVFLWRGWPAVVSGGEPAIEMVREIRTARAEQATIRLTDGTHVQLGPESSLRIRYLTDGPRQVVLEGEAIFDVVHDERRPFRVTSVHAVVEDLGTRFGIRDYPADRSMQVVVQEGIVAVRPQHAPQQPPTVLTPGQLARVDFEGRMEIESDINADGYLGWADDRLYFRQAPLREVADYLERRHGVSIRIADPKASERLVTLDVEATTLSVVLEALAVPLRLQVERSGRNVVLRP